MIASQAAAGFAARYPVLFHVADAGAVASIRQHGLQSAAGLCDRFGVSGPQRVALLEDNRPDYLPLRHPAHGEAWLRRQYAWDQAMRTRLPPELTPAQWRAFLNQHAFLFTGLSQALCLLQHERGRDQRVLTWHTAETLDAGVDLRACRWNNGMVDRSSPERRRLRGPSDYVPVAQWNLALPVREVACPGGIPPTVSHSVLDVPPQA